MQEEAAVPTLEVAELTFAQKLQEVRKEKGVSVAKLAERSGLPVGTVNGYVIGRADPSAENLFKMARALDVSCEEFSDCTSSVEEYEGAGKTKKKRRRRPGEGN